MAIDICDLMRGDWVLYDARPHKVERILSDVVEITNGFMAWKVRPEDLLPIRISPELLMEYGWEKSVIGDVSVDYTLIVGKRDKVIPLCKKPEGTGYSFNGNQNLIITELHELQHLLKLVKVNIKFNLFKRKDTIS